MTHLVGASLSEPHTSVTSLQVVCVCMSACGHIPYILNAHLNISRKFERPRALI